MFRLDSRASSARTLSVERRFDGLGGFECGDVFGDQTARFPIELVKARVAFDLRYTASTV